MFDGNCYRLSEYDIAAFPKLAFSFKVSYRFYKKTPTILLSFLNLILTNVLGNLQLIDQPH
jgi:hypothetical protein